MAASGDPSTFTFTLDAFPDYTKFDRTKKVLASIQVLNADDNYDLNTDELAPNYEYGRFQYNEDTKGNYLWNDKTTGQTKDDTKVGE